ncbi:alpha/beta-hydrolase [Macrolepiota fuliginosa MF-IS2]|uniref:GPI inositol-deacylase n=1 Tax=Macrolepiota fuliginosa MF-IS2 TaxID=1400762 RepID=A0A9P5XBV7_9AGAR|nr:alpha/beta-hydrolase [Macrolepiota fuliginosa MF-IS2]
MTESPTSRPPSRPRLADRLDALLGSRANSPSQSAPHESPRSPLDSPSDIRRPPSVVLASPVTNHPTPILRWLSNWPLNDKHSHSGSESGSGSSSSSPTSSSSDLALLREALREPLIARPPEARLPPPFRARNLTHPPPFLDNLTRSTLPTSSLSPPLEVAISSSDASYTKISPPPIILSHSPPHRSSLDTLRRVSLPPPRPLSTLSTTDSTSSAATASSFLSGLQSTSSFSWWFSEPKDSNDPLLSEEDRNHQLTKKYKSTKNPIVFCHGLLGFDSVTIGPAIAPVQVTHWRGIKEVLEQNGTEVLITRVPATSSYVDRAKVLEERISQVYPGKSVHLIGHSMGGLDCRYLTTHLTQRKFNVLSITTIATPHRGSSFADHFLKTVGPERMPSVMSLLDLLPNGGGDGKAFECLTVESMKKFNEETPNVEGVRYFSWGAVYEPGLIDTWKWPHSVILEKEGPNDGLVSIESAKWGTYLGTLAQVNHLDLVGWINTARYKWAEIMGKEIKFRPATFYLGIADMLAREVEGQGNETEEPEQEGEQAQGTSVPRRSEEQEREQMMHSLEDPSADIEGTDHLSTSTKAAGESRSSSGSATPTASSLLNGPTHTTESNSGDVTPGPINRTDGAAATSEDSAQVEKPEQEEKNRS